MSISNVAQQHTRSRFSNRHSFSLNKAAQKNLWRLSYDSPTGACQTLHSILICHRYLQHHWICQFIGAKAPCMAASVHYRAVSCSGSHPKTMNVLNCPIQRFEQYSLSQVMFLQNPTGLNKCWIFFLAILSPRCNILFFTVLTYLRSLNTLKTSLMWERLQDPLSRGPRLGFENWLRSGNCGHIDLLLDDS